MHEFEMITIMLWLKRFLDQLCTRSIAWKCSFLLVGSVSRFLCEFGVILWFMTSLLVLSFSSNRNISFLHSLLLFFSFSLPPFYPPGRMCSGLAIYIMDIFRFLFIGAMIQLILYIQCKSLYYF